MLCGKGIGKCELLSRHWNSEIHKQKMEEIERESENYERASENGQVERIRGDV